MVKRAQGQSIPVTDAPAHFVSYSREDSDFALRLAGSSGFSSLQVHVIVEEFWRPL